MCVPLVFVKNKFHYFHPVSTILSYLTKAPLVSNIAIELALINTYIKPMNCPATKFLC
jgi:hypothetical protein